MKVGGEVMMVAQLIKNFAPSCNQTVHYPAQ
jgi:hypothetical protein